MSKMSIMKRFILLLLFCSVPFMYAWTVKQAETALPTPTDDFDYSYELPDHYETWEVFGNGLPNMDFVIDNKIATLGRYLFYAKELSNNYTTSCGSCHKQEYAFTDNIATPIGFNAQLNTRNTLHFADLQFTPYKNLYWDDRANDLESVVIDEILDPSKMGIPTMVELQVILDELTHLEPLYQEAYNTNVITVEQAGEALKHFLASIAVVNTRLDNAIQNNLINGNEDGTNWTEQEEAGRLLFISNCSSCHSSIPIDTGLNGSNYFNGPHNIGLEEASTDPGVGGLPGAPSETIGLFKTPSLKNVEFTAPYMHDGRFESLDSVIDFYSEGLQLHPNSAFNPYSPTTESIYSNNPPLPPQASGFGFTETEKEALIAFLKTLSDDSIISDEKFSDPEWDGPSNGIDALGASVLVYPNPSHDMLYLEQNIGTTGSYRIYNATGVLVLSGELNADKQTIETSRLKNGNYLIEILDSEGEGISKKFSVLR